MSGDVYNGLPVLLVGSTGFIGRWVAHALQRRGAQLFLAIRERARTEQILSREGIQATIVELDSRDPNPWPPLVNRLRPAITFNLSGYGVPRSQVDATRMLAVNVELVEQLCRAIGKAALPEWPGFRIVHAGTMAEYGHIGGNLAEDSEPRPATAYAHSKLAGTQQLLDCCRALAYPGVCARIATVYGPGEPAGRLLPTLMEAGRHSDAVPLSAGTQKRDFVYVEDVAEGLVRLGAVPALHGMVVNLASGRLTTVRQFVKTASRVLNLSADRLDFGAIPIRELEESEHLPITVDRLRELLSWSPPTSIAEGVRRTVERARVAGVSRMTGSSEGYD